MVKRFLGLYGSAQTHVMPSPTLSLCSWSANSMLERRPAAFVKEHAVSRVAIVRGAQPRELVLTRVIFRCTWPHMKDDIRKILLSLALTIAVCLPGGVTSAQTSVSTEIAPTGKVQDAITKSGLKGVRVAPD